MGIPVGCAFFKISSNMTWSAHTTVATVVEKDGRFLCVEEIDGDRTVINQPAGHLDEGESLFAAAVRETLEETAWHVTLTDYLGTYVYKAPNGITYVRHCFIARPDRQDQDAALDTGIIAAHWLTREQLMTGNFLPRSPLVLKAIEDYLAGKRLPLDCITHYLDQASEMT